MKLYKFSLLLLALGGIPMEGQAADGTMRFTGRILAATCTVTTPNINVDLGKHARASLTGVGSTTPNKNFQILLNCEKQAKITVTLNGTQDPSNTVGVIALNTAQGSATGIGVQVVDGAGLPKALNQPWLVGSAPNAGVSNINMSGRYYQTASTVTAGVANATLQFTMSYQ